MSRHRDAIFIQQGACNLIALSRTLVKAIDEVRDQGTQATYEDEAVRLILHQMCFLARVSQLNNSHAEYAHCIRVCETKEKEVNQNGIHQGT